MNNRSFFGLSGSSFFSSFLSCPAVCCGEVVCCAGVVVCGGGVCCGGGVFGGGFCCVCPACATPLDCSLCAVSCVCASAGAAPNASASSAIQSVGFFIP